MDGSLVQKLKNQWRNCNSSTVSFANSIPTANWQDKPFDPRFKPYSWEFSCITRTRICYLKGIKTGILKFSESSDIPNKVELIGWEKRKVINKLNELSRNILVEVENIDSYENVSYIIWLFQHERIHHGKLILMLSQYGYKISEPVIERHEE
jgi:hypothetical protein